MTNHLENKLQCACCGMDIYAETSALDVSFKFMADYKSGDERRKQPVHLILDEGHRYIKKDAT